MNFYQEIKRIDWKQTTEGPVRIIMKENRKAKQGSYYLKYCQSQKSISLFSPQLEIHNKGCSWDVIASLFYEDNSRATSGLQECGKYWSGNTRPIVQNSNADFVKDKNWTQTQNVDVLCLTLRWRNKRTIKEINFGDRQGAATRKSHTPG